MMIVLTTNIPIQGEDDAKVSRGNRIIKQGESHIIILVALAMLVILCPTVVESQFCHQNFAEVAVDLSGGSRANYLEISEGCQPP